MGHAPQIALDRAHFPQQREFSLRGRTEEIAPLVEQVTAFIAASHVVPDEEEMIGLALQEALANAVIHGCDGDPEKLVYCAVGCSAEAGVVIVVRDPGPGFDPAAVRNPLSSAGLISDHGRGLHMIRSLMDEVHYERHGTELHMRKNAK